MPTMYIIAGCNGAGKTTAAYNLLPDVFTTVEFINADEIAKGLSPLNAEGAAFAAGRIMLERINEMIEKKESFSFETTLSGLTYISIIQKAIESGYSVVLFFVFIDNFRLAQERVAIRVSKGGHHIPDDVVERRYYKGVKNFSKYKSLVSSWYIYDNSGKEYEEIAKKVDETEEIFNFETYNTIISHGKR